MVLRQQAPIQPMKPLQKRIIVEGERLRNPRLCPLDPRWRWWRLLLLLLQGLLGLNLLSVVSV